MHIFETTFMSQSMYQLFNRAVAVRAENENEAPVHKFLRLAGQLV